MRTSTFLTLISTTLASPLLPRQQSSPPSQISLIALSPNTAIHGQTISASHTHFLINAPTTTSCSLPAPQCTNFSNTTSISVGQRGGGVDLLAGVPGSQGVFVDGTTGALSFTAAGSNRQTPPGAIGTGFYVNSTVWGGFEFDLVQQSGETVSWVACPDAAEGDNVWQVLAKVEGVQGICAGAAEMTIAAMAVSGFGAYQYD